MEVLGKKLNFPKGRERTALFISLGISLLIWFSLKLSKSYETARAVQLTYELPPLMEFTETPPSTIIAEVVGQGIELTKSLIANRNPTITIDLAQYSRPEIQREVLIAKIEEELSLDIKDINRNYISFSIDSTATLEVPVEVALQLNFARDFFMKDSVRISDQKVIISGALNEIQQIDKVVTQPLTATNVKSDLKQTLSLQAGNFKTIKIIPPEVQVFIPVEQYTEKSFNLPVKAVYSQDSVQILPSNVELTCIVGISKYEELRETDFLAEVNLDAISKPDIQSSAPVNLSKAPSWVKSIKISPKAVDYLIVK